MPLTCKALTIMKPRTCAFIHVIFSYKTTTSAHPPCVKPEQVLLWLALFMLCNMALTFTFVNEILKCNHWNLKAPEQHFPVVLFIKLRKVVLTFESVDQILEWLFKWKLVSSTFLWYCFFLLYEVLLTCGCVDEILGCNYSKESNRAVFFCYTIYHADCARWF